MRGSLYGLDRRLMIVPFMLYVCPLYSTPYIYIWCCVVSINCSHINKLELKLIWGIYVSAEPFRCVVSTQPLHILRCDSVCENGMNVCIKNEFNAFFYYLLFNYSLLIVIHENYFNMPKRKHIALQPNMKYTWNH